MRIGIVTGEYPPMQGGVGAYSRILARTLVQQGHQVVVFSSTAADSQDAGISLNRSANGWGVGSLRSIHRWAQEHDLDVLNLQFQTAAYQMSPWIHFLPQVVRKAPVVTTFHDLRFPYLFPKAGRLREWIVMHLGRASDGVIVTNHEDWQQVQHLPYAALIPIGSNIPTALPADFNREAWRRQAGAGPGDFLLAHFGFVNRSKGLETLLTSLAEMRSRSLPVRLLMIGGRTGASDPTNAAYADELEAFIDQRGLTAHVSWTGFVDEKAVSAYLAACDAVALPFADGASYRRGSLMAAIHHGCAIITTRPHVNIPTFIDHENMLLIPPGDRGALVEAVRQLHDSPELRERLQEGAKQLSAQFDWTQIALECASFFERVLRARRAVLTRQETKS